MLIIPIAVVGLRASPWPLLLLLYLLRQIVAICIEFSTSVLLTEYGLRGYDSDLLLDLWSTRFLVVSAPLLRSSSPEGVQQKVRWKNPDFFVIYPRGTRTQTALPFREPLYQKSLSRDRLLRCVRLLLVNVHCVVVSYVTPVADLNLECASPAWSPCAETYIEVICVRVDEVVVLVVYV